MREGPVLLQGAMDAETEALIAGLDRAEAIRADGFSFWRGRLGRTDTVVSRTGIGAALAAGATAVGVMRFQPSVVLNQGLAGAHREDLRVGDVVIGETCVAIHDLMMPPRGRGEGMAPEQWTFHDHREPGEPAVFSADRAWVARLMSAPYAFGRKAAGRLGGGDVFNREYDRILWLRERGGEDCEDMESAAVYQLCQRMGVPCVGVRIISNNELTGEPYRRETGEALQRFLMEVIRGL